MLNVFICEDNESHRAIITKCVEGHMVKMNYNMEIVISTHDPVKIIDFVKTSATTGLYFLDMDLNHEIDGLGLSSEIRKHDARGFIVFVTNHDEILPFTFKYRVEAMDYIVKDVVGSVKNRICECIDDAWGRYTAINKSVETYEVSKRVKIPYNKIIYFEKVENSKIIQVYCIMENGHGMHSVFDSLNNVENALSDNFFRCHQSYIVNLNHVKKFDEVGKMVHMVYSGRCPVAKRKVKELSAALLSRGK